MMNTAYAIVKERIYLFSPAACIQMQVTLAKAVSADALCKAIHHAAVKQATLCSYVQQRPDGSAFFIPCEPAVPRVCPIKPGDTLQTVMHREMRTPFAIEQGEWMRHYLVETDGKSIWLLSCHHMAGDGRSLLYFIRDVEMALREPALSSERQPFTLCTAAGTVSGPMRWGLQAINRQWEKTGQIFSAEDRERITEAYWAERSVCMLHTTVDNVRLENVLQACRNHRVTLTAAWLASVLLCTHGVMDAGIAVDIRPKSYEGMANWATGISVRCASGGEFWHMAQKLYRLMRQKLANPRKRDFLLHLLQTLSPTLIDAAYFAAFDGLENGAAKKISAMFGYNGRPKTCSVTNLLRAPFTDDALEQVVFYPPMVPNARQLFGMVTTCGNLEITLQSFAGEPETSALLDAVLACLLRACEA